MKITKFINKNQIILDLQVQTKNEVLETMLGKFVELGLVPGEMREDVLNALRERENLTSTGLGYGVALPHVKTDAVGKINIVFARCIQGLDFESLDGNPVQFLFMILAPTKVTDDYLKLLSAISALMKDARIRRRMTEAKTDEDIQSILG
jgi:fructose-specific phosphotransferase system IIA component